MKKLIVLLLLLIMKCNLFAWWDTSWSSRNKITYDVTKASDAVTNIPLYIEISTSTTNVGTFFSNANADFSDIRFIDNDDLALLDHETVSYSYSASSGVYRAYIEIPSISTGTADPTIYIYYGNSSAADISNSTSTWDSNYRNVSHFESDSNAALNYETTVFASATHFDADVMQLDNGNIGLLNLVGSTDVEFWTSTDNGVTFSKTSDVTVGNSADMVQLSNGNIVVCYKENATNDATVKISADNGATWGSAIDVDTGANVEPAIGLLSDDSTLLVASYDGTDGDFFVYTSTDDAATWQYGVEIGTSSESLEGKSIVDLGDVILIATEKEYVSGGRSEIWQWTSTDSASTFQFDQVIQDSLSNISDNEEGEYINFTSSHVWYVFTTDEDDSVDNQFRAENVSRVKYLESTDAGTTWGVLQDISQIQGRADATSTVLSDGNAYIFYTQYPDKNYGYAVNQSSTYITNNKILQPGAGNSTGRDSVVAFNHQRPLEVDGKIGKGFDFASSGFDVFTATSAGEYSRWMNGATGITMEAWINPDSVSGNDSIISGHINTTSTGMLLRMVNGKLSPGGRSQTGDSFRQLAGAVSITAGSWWHVVGVLDIPNDKIDVYVNGVLDKTGAASWGQNTYTAGGTYTRTDYYGSLTGLSDPYDGQLDEVKMSNIARNNAWIFTQYNSENDSSTFWALSSGESIPSGNNPGLGGGGGLGDIPNYLGGKEGLK